MARSLFAGALRAEEFNDLIATGLALGAGVLVEPEFTGPGAETLLGELRAEELWEDCSLGEYIHNAVVREIYADDFARNKEVERSDGKVDNSGDAVESKFECDCA
jgi:hypothetical protein